MKTITIEYPSDKIFRFQHPSTLNNKELLELLFAEWNAGSMQECDLFLNGNNRSMSVGDYVAIDEQWYICLPCGWAEITEEEKKDYVRRIEHIAGSDRGLAFGAANRIAWEIYKPKIQIQVSPETVAIVLS